MFYLAQPGQVYSNGQKNYEVIEAIGFGVNGIVYKAKDSYGNILALKYQKEFFKREYLLLQHLVEKTCQMNHVIKILDVFPENPDMDTGPLITIMELGEQDFDKYTSLQEYQNLTNMQKLFEASEILQGIEELHANDLFHRDIKPQNIVKVQGKWKLCDLGLIKQFQEKDPQQTRMVGTGLYLSPELYADSIYLIDKKVDVWSFAVMLYYLIYNEYPFDPKILRKPNGQFDEKIMNIRKSNDRNIDELMQLMLKVNPEKRINSHKALVFLKTKILNQQMEESLDRENKVQQNSKVIQDITIQGQQLQKIQQSSVKKSPSKKEPKQNEKQPIQNEMKSKQDLEQIQQEKNCSQIIMIQDHTKINGNQLLNSGEMAQLTKEEIKQKNKNVLIGFINEEGLLNGCIAIANQTGIPKDKRNELLLARINQVLKPILNIDNLNKIIKAQKQ